MSEFEFEIKPGKRLPPETRMELPEMSYEQELLNTPVPFANRTEAISDYVKLDTQPKTLQEIATKLGVSERLIKEIAREVGADCTLGEDGTYIYQPLTLEVIDEEMHWRLLVDALDENLSAYEVARHIDKTTAWVERMAYGLGIYPQLKTIGNGREIRVYPKELVTMLREVLLQTPPSNDMYSLREIIEMVGKDRKWVKAMIELHALPHEERLYALSDRTGTHYPQETLNMLRMIANQLPPPAGNWMTAKRIGNVVGKKSSWVVAHLGEMQKLGEMRQDDTAKVVVHYPPEALEFIKSLFDTMPQAAGDWVTRNRIAHALGRTASWVIPRLQKYEGLAETRLQAGGRRQLVHYPPYVLNELAVESKSPAP